MGSGISKRMTAFHPESQNDPTPGLAAGWLGLKDSILPAGPHPAPFVYEADSTQMKK
jgi:hypothetical protein